MNKLQKLSELAQMQAKLAPQIEAAKALYRNVPPETLSLLQKMAASPIYKTMASLPARQLENAALSAKAEKEAVATVDAFLSAFEKMTPEEQKSVIDGASSVEVPKEIFEQAVDESPEKQSLNVDIPFSVEVLPKDIDSSWMQIRKALYPIVGDKAAIVMGALNIWVNVYGSCDPTLKSLLGILAAVVLVVHLAGNPDKQINTRQEASNR